MPSRLLEWYDRHARQLPWRVGPAERAQGVRPDPYRVWLAEIMLQQTTIPHGTPYFLRFTERWPTVDDLAAAADEDVMAAWAGLGYYARARNLLKCARIVSEKVGFPTTAKDLQKLPGIGPYTSGAIAALAFGERASAVDGNVERVVSRLLALDLVLKEAKTIIRTAVDALVPDDKPAEFAEAMMDLGATICTPKSPDCLICPLRDLCAAHAMGQPDAYPKKAPKTEKPKRYGHVFLLRSDGQLLLERRPETGLLGGMLGLPSSEWQRDVPKEMTASDAPINANWQERGEVRHVFTHFALFLTVWEADTSDRDVEGIWVEEDQIEGLPSVFAKAVKQLS